MEGIDNGRLIKIETEDEASRQREGAEINDTDILTFASCLIHNTTQACSYATPRLNRARHAKYSLERGAGFGILRHGSRPNLSRLKFSVSGTARMWCKRAVHEDLEHGIVLVHCEKRSPSCTMGVFMPPKLR
jgi:hypothetical protein